MEQGQGGKEEGIHTFPVWQRKERVRVGDGLAGMSEHPLTHSVTLRTPLSSPPFPTIRNISLLPSRPLPFPGQRRRAYQHRRMIRMSRDDGDKRKMIRIRRIRVRCSLV